MKKFTQIALRSSLFRGIFLILASATLGCQDEINIPDKTSESLQAQINEKCSVDNGILVFNDRKSFDEALSELSQLPYSEYLNWVEALGFKSQYFALSQIWKENEKYDDYLFRNQIENPEREYSELYYYYLERGLIREYMEDGQALFELTTATPYLSKILNVDGFLKVGDTLIQVTDELIKLWDYGSAGNLEQLKSSSDLNLSEGVEIWKLRQSESVTLKSTINDFSTFSPNNPISTGWRETSQGGRRLELKVYFRSWEVINYDSFNSNKYHYEHWWYSRSQKKNWLNKWKDYSYPQTIKGSWNARVELLNDYTLGSDYIYYNIADYSWTTDYPIAGYSVALHNKQHGLRGTPFETWISGGGLYERRTILNIEILNANWTIESFVNGALSYP